MIRLACAALPLLLLAPAVAHADVIAPDEAACQSGKEGDVCDLDNGVKGKCAKAKCHRNDYSDGPPPKSITSDCLKCIEASDGAAADSATPTDQAEGDDEGGGDGAPTEVKADEPETKTAAPEDEPEPEPEPQTKTEAEVEDTKKADATKDATHKDEKGGCTAGGPLSMTSVALGLVVLLGLGRGRRAR
jgi:outer membrane biosynthesis protein TonB